MLRLGTNEGVADSTASDREISTSLALENLSRLIPFILLINTSPHPPALAAAIFRIAGSYTPQSVLVQRLFFIHSTFAPHLHTPTEISPSKPPAQRVDSPLRSQHRQLLRRRAPQSVRRASRVLEPTLRSKLTQKHLGRLHNFDCHILK